ncbi:hypothetical protein Q1695_000094 [Nippostrongylus brasiliensis]|nr:hypothetical protein Q1695_000094 [Nippostrongylus brasiliensis]
MSFSKILLWWSTIGEASLADFNEFFREITKSAPQQQAMDTTEIECAADHRVADTILLSAEQHQLPTKAHLEFTVRRNVKPKHQHHI